MWQAARRKFHRILIRRRHIDPVVLTAAGAGIVLPFNIGAVLFGAFLASGLYLLVFRPRSAKPIDPGYAMAAGILAFGAIAIGFANGSLPGDWRWASYPVYYLGALPIAAGLCLVRDPLRQFVIGARLGMVILAIWAAVALSQEHGRYGFNSNPANAAFAISFIAIISRLEISAAPRLFANHPVWSYLALFPILATGTRAALPVFLVAFLIDLAAIFRGRAKSPNNGKRGYRLVLPVLLAIVLAGGALLTSDVQQRITATIAEMDNLEAVPNPEKGGMTIRLSQWTLASEVIAGEFWIGIGGAAILPALLEKSPPAYRHELGKYPFVHNVILDEWLQRGFLGVVLLSGFFIYSFGRIYRYGSPSMKSNVILTSVLTVSFGMLHYLLLVDRHVALYALYFMFLTTDIHRRHHKTVWRQQQQ